VLRMGRRAEDGRHRRARPAGVASESVRATTGRFDDAPLPHIAEGEAIPSVERPLKRGERRVGPMTDRENVVQTSETEERTVLIRRRAYELWEVEGRPSGRETVHWLVAEQEFALDPLGGSAEQDPATLPRIEAAPAHGPDAKSTAE
jgi:hypothetical protein